MAVPANPQVTMVYNAANNGIDVVNNVKETSNGQVMLPGATQSMAATSDATLGFVAVPEAPVAGLAPGEVETVNLTNTALGSPVCVPTPSSSPQNGACVTPEPNIFSGARYLALSPDNVHLLIFGDLLTVVTLTNIGTSASPNWVITQAGIPSVAGTSDLDHPVWATFSPDNSMAYVFSCGPECGGTTASVTPLSFKGSGSCAQNCLGATIPLAGGATYAVASGNTVYVAGSAACLAPGAQPSSCGKLSILNTSSGSVQLLKTVSITDGFHHQIAVTMDNQVFIGAEGCTGACLSIYNANNGQVVIGSDLGDVTGIQPLSGRPQVYVVENGELRNWSTLNDALAPPQQQMDIVGQAVDVKLVD
ncbi:MAG: hypothetical protein JO266_12115 [Acidobacteria bacterium]|nr:hypothetical protein [Acidobacteriota bacterium]